MIELFNETCFECSKVITTKYSTSFSLGISAFDKRFRNSIYAVYGFVRYADEIVDTFHDYDQADLIKNFKIDCYSAIEQRISLNPILNAFQLVVNKYHIETGLIEAFFKSMEMDLDKTQYCHEGYNSYIYGSAEVVGLMCLRVFCENDDAQYRKLEPLARSLGAALQKVNFLRDIKADHEELGRTYFPEIDFNHFTEADKQKIEADIKNDFDLAFEGIKQLPKGTRLGVYIAYLYYLQLFKKIKRVKACTIAQKRIRVADWHKLALYFKAVLKQKLNAI